MQLSPSRRAKIGLRPGPRRLLLLSGVLLYAALYLNRHMWHYPVPSWLSSHGADLLAMPILLSLTLAMQRRLSPQFCKLVLPDSWLLGAWLTVSVWFEGVLPYFSAVAVADPLDVAAYGVGTLAFRRWFNRAEQ